MKKWIMFLVAIILFGCSDIRKEYHDNGQILSEIEYKNDISNGPFKYYDENGNVSLSGNYLNGEFHGVGISYYKNGNIDTKKPWKNGIEHGIVTHYFETGELKDSVFYIDGLVDGVAYSYYIDGNLQKVCAYQSGILNGYYKSYYLNGSLKMQATYINDDLAGFIAYDSLGNPLDEFSSGEYYVYFRDGIKIQGSKFINSCIINGNTKGMDKILDIESYCNCVLLKLAAKYKSTEITGIFEEIYNSNTNTYEKGQDFYHSPGIKELIEPCVTENMLYVQNIIDIKSKSKEEKEVLINEYKNALEALPEYKELEELVNIDDFCECMVMNLFNVFSYYEIMTDLDLSNNPKYSKIQSECILKSAKK